MPVAAIRPRHVAEYVAAASRDSGAATVSRDLAVLHAIFKTAFREELVDRNPAEAAERPKLPPFRPQILEPGEVARVAKAFTDEPARVAFLLLVLTGIRRGELQRLRWRDIDLVGNVLRVVDSKSETDAARSRFQRHSLRGSGSTGARRRSRATTSSCSATRRKGPSTGPHRSRRRSQRLSRPQAWRNSRGRSMTCDIPRSRTMPRQARRRSR
jgi:integrase